MMASNNLLKVDLLLEKIVANNNDRVADLGCGSFGYFVFPLAKKIGRHGKIYAVDIIKNNLAAINNMARSDNLSQIETVWSNLEIYRGTKIDDNSLDAALLVSTLNQSQQPLDILKEAVRMLKPGGRLLIVEWSEGDSLFGNKPNKTLTQRKLKENLKHLPLALQEEFPAGDYHYALLLTKN